MNAPYKRLFTYWFSVIIYDLTVQFCDKWIRSYKLREQMTGAARSGKQNIVEGSDGLKTSIKTGIKLTNVAKMSLEELIGDYEDFLRQRKLLCWGKEDSRVIRIRKRSSRFVRDLSILREDKNGKLVQMKLSETPEKATNLLLTLCHQATYLLNKQVESLEQKHEREGGYTEKLYKKRTEYRKIHK